MPIETTGKAMECQTHWQTSRVLVRSAVNNGIY